MSSNRQQRGAGRVSILSDLYIDFLGSLVPGLFTIVLAGAVLFPSAFVLCQSLSASSSHGTETNVPPTVPTSGTPDVWIGPYGTTAIALVLAYVMGSVFYRQDPKLPDWRSASFIWRNTKSKEDRERLAVQPTSERAEDISAYDAQFPYFFLHEYLVGRGLDHLADWIPWEGRKPETWIFRTKMFINVLKVRLQFLIPERCKEIVRNEAHVRMATSVWYATYWVMVASGLGLVLVVVAWIRSVFVGIDIALPGTLAVDLLVLIVAVVMKFKIERFLHYLRVREVVYVLETAYFANLNGFDMRTGDLRVPVSRGSTTKREASSTSEMMPAPSVPAA